MEKQKQKVSRPFETLGFILTLAFWVSLSGCAFSGCSQLFSYYFPAKKAQQPVESNGELSATPGTITAISYSGEPPYILIPKPGTYSFLLPAAPDDPEAWGQWLSFLRDDFVYRFHYDAPSYDVFFQRVYRDGTFSPVIRDNAPIKHRPEKPVSAIRFRNADSRPVGITITVAVERFRD